MLETAIFLHSSDAPRSLGFEVLGLNESILGEFRLARDNEPEDMDQFVEEVDGLPCTYTIITHEGQPRQLQDYRWVVESIADVMGLRNTT